MTEPDYLKGALEADLAALKRADRVFRPVVKGELVERTVELSPEDIQALAIGRLLTQPGKGTILDHLVKSAGEMPAIHFHAGDVSHTVEPGAVQVTNTPPAVNIEKGAVQVTNEQPSQVEGDAIVDYDNFGRVRGIRRR